MEETIALFVEQSRQLLAEFSMQARPSDANSASQRLFIAKFTRMIEDFLDSLCARRIEVGAQLALLLLECCAQMRRLADALGAPQPGNDVTAPIDALQRRLAAFVDAPAEQVEPA